MASTLLAGILVLEIFSYPVSSLAALRSLSTVRPKQEAYVKRKQAPDLTVALR